MTNLQFDVQAAKEQLTQLLRDRVAAEGSIFNVQTVDFEPVLFPDLQTASGNEQALFEEMNAVLVRAKSHCQTWSNDVQPKLTAIPQAAINYASILDSALPLVLAELRAAPPNRAQLRALFAGLATAIETQAASVRAVAPLLRSLESSFAADAADFSNRHAPFRELEDLDQKNIEAARAAIGKLQAMIAEFDEEIGVDTIENKKEIGVGRTSLKNGAESNQAGRLAGVTSGLIMFVSVISRIQEMVALIEQRLQKARESAEYETELGSLTAQLLALDTTAAALSAADTAAGGLIATVNHIIDGWKQHASGVAEVIAQLSGDQPVAEILSEFDLERTQSEWDELRTFATQWQTMEIVTASIDVAVFDDSADNVLPFHALHAIA
jgi:hypothetical protein